LLIRWKPVAAIVLMGDPSTTKGQAFHVGSSKGDGVSQQQISPAKMTIVDSNRQIFPPNKPNGCHYVSGKTVSFCDAGDPFCEAGGHDLSTHMRYVSAYGQMAADFSVSMFHLA
jgi:acetylxylan esterase